MSQCIAIAISASGFCVAQHSPPPQSADSEAEGKLLALVGDGFHLRRSEHFAVAYDVANFEMDPFAARLEQVHDAVKSLCTAARLEVKPLSSRLQAVFFDQPQTFDRFRRRTGVRLVGGVGGYDQETNLALFYNLRNHPDSLKVTDAFVEKFNRLVLQHEIAHQVLFNSGVHVRGADNPVWLVEGLACQFEVPRIGTKKELPEVNDLRLADLREAFGLVTDAKRVSDARWRATVADGKVVELADLIGDDRSLDPNAAHAAYRYAQAWAFVYYLRQEHRDSFMAYLRLSANRRPGEVVPKEREIAEFESCFGRLGNSFTRRWLDFISGL